MSDKRKEFQWACGHGKVEHVIKLLNKGAEVDLHNKSYGWTAFHEACYNNRPDIVKVLLKYNRKYINQHDGIDEDTPLHLTCKRGYMECMKLLLATGQCNLGAKNSSGRAPLGEAIVENRLEIVKYLITEQSVDVSAPVTSLGDTPLAVAICHERLDIVKYLVTECKVRVNGLTATTEKAPLAVAFYCGNLHVIKYLVNECKANVNVPITKRGHTLLGLAVRRERLNIIKYLVDETDVKVNDYFLHLACEYDHPNVVNYLLTNLHINPNTKNSHQQSPLSLAKSKEVIKLLLQHGADAEDVYTEHRKTLGNIFSKDPLKSPVKMFVIGHSGEGKSTLIEAMEHEPGVLSPLVNVFIRPKEVAGVSQRTAGIVPRVFKSHIYGDVLFYDLAGQEAYYSSHSAIIKSVVDMASPVFLLVIGLHRCDTTTTYSVSYWLGMITNQCSNVEGKAPLIVVGSHADLVDSVTEVNRKKQIIQQAVQKFCWFDLVAIISIDCRYSNSDGMKLLRRHVGFCCTTIQSNLSVSLNSHMFLIYLLDNYSTQVAVTLHQVKARLETRLSLLLTKKEKAVISFIPTTIQHLIEICHQLSDKGHILFLLNKLSPIESYIIIDKTAVLTDVNGTIFAPKDLKEHCQLATSTGVVPRSKLAEHFKKYNTEMLIWFLSYLELAVPIDDTEILSLISKHKTSSEELAERESYLFCPALIRLTVPKDVFTHLPTLVYHFGWILTCVDIDHFFNPRFLHVLILRLALTFGFTPEIPADLPALQRECSVWKTGVCWCTRQGIKVLVEVIDKKQVVVLVQSHILSAAVLELQSLVIQKVRAAALEFCLTTTTRELFVSPADVAYPLNSKSYFSIKSVAHSIVNQDPCIVSTSNTETLPVGILLPAEVYANLGENILQVFFNESDMTLSMKVSDQFLLALHSVWNKNPKLVAIISSSLTQGAEIIPQTGEIDLEVALKSWRNGSDGTYRSLREILDQLSVFSGRNPLELVGVHNKVFSDDLLPSSTSSANKPTSTGTLTFEELKRETRVDDSQLATMIREEDITKIAGLFDDVETYLDKLGLFPAQQTDVKDIAYQHSTALAITKALKLWCQPNPFAATFEALLQILLDLRRGDVAIRVCQYIIEEVPKHK